MLYELAFVAFELVDFAGEDPLRALEEVTRHVVNGSICSAVIGACCW